MTPLLRSLREHLLHCLASPWLEYTVPGEWVGSDEPVTFPSAPSYVLHQLDVMDEWCSRKPRREWASDDVAYNAIVRNVTSYSHNSTHSPGDGWRSTGTFIKLLALLPYLRRMGVGTLCLLPITDIGKVGRKGTLGSPYAVKNPFRLDPLLAEPNIPLSVDDQCRMLIEMAHLLGMKVVLEVVLRTASIDADFIAQRPDWFYWVDEDSVKRTGGKPVKPQFTDVDIERMTEKVLRADFNNLPEPPVEYQDLFTAPPQRILADVAGWKGVGFRGTTLRVPGAFADWPADDPQPAWDDVTYFKLHDHQHFRYMAYNTVRMYDRKLDVPQHRQLSLWNTIAGCIPHYIRTLNIDGATIDMGHALPSDLRRQVIREARLQKPDFILYEETFHIKAVSAAAGYNGVVGYLPFIATDITAVKAFIAGISATPVPVRFFATPETHNTPRASTKPGTTAFAACMWTVFRCLPGAIPYITEGYELGEQVPINTGLEFTDAERARWTVDKLPMFSDIPLSWGSNGVVRDTIVALESKLRESSWWHQRSDSDDLIPIDAGEHVVSYIRKSHHERRGLLVMANMSGNDVVADVVVDRSIGLLSIETCEQLQLTQDGSLLVQLAPWESLMVFTLHQSRYKR